MGTDLQTTVKSWWDRPEGKFGFWFLAILLCGIVGAGVLTWATVVLPMIATIAASTFSIALSCTGLFVLYMVLHSKTVHAAFRVACYRLAGLFVTVDPIGIARDRIMQMKKALAKMEDNMGKLLGRKRALDNEIAANEKGKTQQAKMVEAAKARGMTKDATLAAEQIGRLTEANNTLREVSKRLEFLYRRLDQMHEVADYNIKSTTADVDLKEKTWAAIKDANSAMKSAMSIMKGDPDEVARFEMAMQVMADDISMKTGEIENWSNQSEVYVNSNNLQRDILAKEGFDELANQSSLLLSDGQLKQIVVQTEDHNDVLVASRPTSKSSYSAYLNQ